MAATHNDPENRLDVGSGELSEEERMLVQVRDTLYEGNWDDFISDLKGRLESKPYVFDIVPATDQVKERIRAHLTLIQRLREWETTHEIRLRVDVPGVGKQAS